MYFGVTMKIEEHFPIIDKVLSQWSEELGADFEAYKNHLYRMANFSLVLSEANDVQKEKIEIAAAFHDLGIWSEGTVDYLDPSVQLAKDYLAESEQQDWEEEIVLMIDLHHKFTAYKDLTYPLVEVFRRADLVDLSFGMVRFGISKSYVKQVKDRFPNAGFHKRLGQLTVQQLKTHPLKPLPMMKW